MDGKKNLITPSLKKKLNTANLINLYDIITYLPFRLQKIEPFSNFNTNSETTYLYTGKLTNISHRKSSRPFLVLDFTGSTNLTAYLFSIAKFTMATLKVGQEYQLLVTQKDNLWSIKRYSPYVENKIKHDSFTLGKAQQSDYLVPVYKKIGEMKHADFNKLHKILPENSYNLNLEGILPKNSILPTTINIKSIHKPSSLKDFNNGLSQWISLKAFLKICTISYKEYINNNKQAKISKFDREYLNNLTKTLNYKLSTTQISTIKDLVGEITY